MVWVRLGLLLYIRLGLGLWLELTIFGPVSYSLGRLPAASEYMASSKQHGTETYLLVTINGNMKVSEQCRIAPSRGNQVLGMIRRSITYKV